MIILSADNRSLLASAPYTYLVDNVSSGVSTLSVVNASDFTAGDLVLVGLFGNEGAEIFRVLSVSTTANTLAIGTKAGAVATTAYAHSESTKVSKIQFNEVRFYWTAATGTIADENPVFDTANPLTGWLDLTPSDWFTTYADASHSTGFGWFVFRNSISLEASQNSNAIPYAGLGLSTAQYVINDFMSLLNSRELKLVTQDDMFSWLNEALATTLNKLNLSSPEYTVSAPVTITTIPGTYEYQLASDFGDLVQIVDESNYAVPAITIQDAMQYVGSDTRYYIRGRYIGFAPTPDTATTYTYRYRGRGTTITSLDDYIDLPDNGTNILKDWMMYRACLKFQNPNASTYYKSFADGLNGMIASSVKRDANLDSWGIAPWASA